MPRADNKPLLGGGLAVIGVNIVIASFLFQAFREDIGPAPKLD